MLRLHLLPLIFLLLLNQELLKLEIVNPNLCPTHPEVAKLKVAHKMSKVRDPNQVSNNLETTLRCPHRSLEV
jgi:hypothetical protein